MTYPLLIDEKVCQKEINAFINATKSISKLKLNLYWTSNTWYFNYDIIKGYLEELDKRRFNETKTYFKDVLTCFFQTYKQISTFVVKYKNIFLAKGKLKKKR